MEGMDREVTGFSSTPTSKPSTSSTSSLGYTSPSSTRGTSQIIFHLSYPSHRSPFPGGLIISHSSTSILFKGQTFQGCSSLCSSFFFPPPRSSRSFNFCSQLPKAHLLQQESNQASLKDGHHRYPSRCQRFCSPQESLPRR